MERKIVAGAFMLCVITGERVPTKNEYLALIGKAKEMGIDTQAVRKQYGLAAYEQLKNMIE